MLGFDSLHINDESVIRYVDVTITCKSVLYSNLTTHYALEGQCIIAFNGVVSVAYAR